MTTPKSVVRKFAPFSSFQKYLVSETSVGNISRQEAVSMIPPLLMDVKPGMTVLDLCAAPGSKSAQLIEMVHAGEEARMKVVANRLKKKNESQEDHPSGVKAEPDTLEDTGNDWSDDGRTTGLLVANDVDYKRAHMLIHQMKRLNSPNLIVTNHDATLYPSIKLPSDPAPAGGVARGKYLKFDRILADVPCSGDGTCRKNINVWKDWNPANALGLHLTQVRILVRAIQMLKVGGRVVYSTCSMNPLENEAVVTSAIERCGGLSKIDLVDCNDKLPALKRNSGLQTWKVMDKHGRLWTSWDEVEKHGEENGADSVDKLSEGMFPPSKVEPGSDNIPLERCMRVYGHQQDTGGFFITVLEKRSEIRARPEGQPKKVEQEPHHPEHKGSVLAVVAEIEAQPTDGDPLEHIKALDDLAPPNPNDIYDEGESTAALQNMENLPSDILNPQKRELDDINDAEMALKRPKFRNDGDDAAAKGDEDRQVHFPPPPGAQLDLTRHADNPAPITAIKTKKRNNQPFEEPFKYLAADNEEIQTIFDFYNIHLRFSRDRFMVRNAMGNPVKTIYYTSALARSILTENEGKGLKFVHCGVKMFVKQDVQREDVCRWRIQTDGLPIIEAWVGEERVIKLWSRTTFRKLLVEMFPKVSGDSWKDLGEIGEWVRDVSMGCCVLRVEKGEGEDAFGEDMVLPLWRSLHSLNLMLPKEDRKAMLLRLYNDDSPLEDSSQMRFKGKKEEPEESRSPSPVAANGNGVVKDEDVDVKMEENGDDDGEMDKEIEEERNEEAKAEVDVALGAKTEEDIGFDGGVELE
jgi:multisite-specific tRNA:(cytosine-C5)-methyltransferase